MQTGLLSLAESRYLEAAKLAQAQGNSEMVTTIQATLGEIYSQLGDEDEAVRRLSEAQAGYEGLGDTQQLAEVK